MTTTTIESKELKGAIKEALDATGGSVTYPDLLMYLAQKFMRESLDNALQALEEKGRINRKSDQMGEVIEKRKA